MRKIVSDTKPGEIQSLKSLNSIGANCRQELIKQNNAYKRANLREKPKEHFKISSIGKEISLSNTIEVFPGNYCYPLRENYLCVREKNFFYRYYGEEKIDEVTKKQNSTSLEVFSNIPDDILSNAFVMHFCKNTNNLKELSNEIKSFFSLKKVDARTISKRIKKLYDRYHTLLLNKNKYFYHMSCGANEDKDLETLIGTNKQLFCGICWKYDCSMHQQPDNFFDNPMCYNIKEYLRTYKALNEISLGALKDKEDPLSKLIHSNCEKYNTIIQDNKFAHFSGYINIFEEKTMGCYFGKSGKQEQHCGELCFKNFLSLDKATRLEIITQMGKMLPNIFELYLSKLVRIMKYDPCSIAKCLQLVRLDNKSTQYVNYSLIECYLIFIRLISDDFSIGKPLSKELIELFIKERMNDRKKILEPQRLKLIKENAKNNKIIPYQPCYHLGSEICNDKCSCAKRGFCEKYCACNKVLCKLGWSGCHCRGPCNSSLCPCYVNSRECDTDLCQNCRIDNSSCKNLKLSQKNKKRLGVGNSKIVGWGLFARENIAKDELIGEYIGELVDMNDLNERSEFIDLEKSTYMFTLNDEYTVDSRSMGNCLRFANHSKSQANAYTRIVFANGNHRICLFASEDIKKDEEIFFDYDGQNILCNKYDWINDEKVPERKVKKGIKIVKNTKSEMLQRKRQRDKSFSNLDRERNKKEKREGEEEEEVEEEHERHSKGKVGKQVSKLIKNIKIDVDFQNKIQIVLESIRKKYPKVNTNETNTQLNTKNSNEVKTSTEVIKRVCYNFQ